MSRAGRWIFSISGNVAPADAPEDFASRDLAIAAATDSYWPAEARALLRAQYPTGYKLRFFVGLVSPAVRIAISGSELINDLIDAQAAQHRESDMPVTWPPSDAAALRSLETMIDAAMAAWLRQYKADPNWDTVAYEMVEVDA